MRITDIIQQEITTFKKPVSILNGITFDHYDIIKRINLYMNDEFYECTEDGAIFWNIAKSRSPHFAKKIDLDTKNFKIEAQGDNNFYQGWIINLRFQRWCRDSGFALDLNDLSEGLADYGSLVMKLVDTDKGKKLKECDFMKLYFDTTAETLDGQTVIEEHEMTEAQIRDKGWNNIEDALKNADKVKETDKEGMITKYCIYERVGYFKKKEDTKPVFRHTIVCGSGDKEVILYEKDIKPEKSPYFDFHISKYRGRFLRVGVYERLFQLQERVSTLVNENAANSAIASLLLMRSTDKRLIGKNVLQEAISGMILDTDDLSQIDITSTYLNGFLAEMNLMEIQADKLCMTSDFVTGDDLPKGITFRGQAAMTNAATSSFKNARDRVGFSLFRVIIDHILPDEVARWNDEDVFEIAGSDRDVQIYDEVALKFKTADFIKQGWAQGQPPTPQEIEQYQRELVNEFETKGRRIEGLKDFFNFKYGFVMNPTGENVNKEQKNDVYFNALQMYQMNPNIANNPIFKQYLEDNGIPPFKINQDQIDKFMQTNTGSAAPVNRQDKLSAQIDTQV